MLNMWSTYHFLSDLYSSQGGALVCKLRRIVQSLWSSLTECMCVHWNSSPATKGIRMWHRELWQIVVLMVEWDWPDTICSRTTVLQWGASPRKSETALSNTFRECLQHQISSCVCVCVCIEVLISVKAVNEHSCEQTGQYRVYTPGVTHTLTEQGNTCALCFCFLSLFLWWSSLSLSVSNGQMPPLFVPQMGSVKPLCPCPGFTGCLDTQKQSKPNWALYSVCVCVWCISAEIGLCLIHCCVWG